jgi:putative hydrolase of the HAD superfamily
MPQDKHQPDIRCILFDYGGVIAEEGFRNTFTELSLAAGKPAEWLPELAMDAVYRSAYVTGEGDEQAFWRELARSFPLPEPPAAISERIQQRFTLREEMIRLVRTLRRIGLQVAILSDQTDWLDRLEQRDHFFEEFDHVFNSYHLGKGKRDPTLFRDVVEALRLQPSQVIFIDDSKGNIERARTQGLHTILYQDHQTLLQELEKTLGIALRSEAG